MIKNKISTKNFLYNRFFKLFSLMIIINFFLVFFMGVYQYKSINKIYSIGLYKALEQDKSELLDELVLNEQSVLKEHLTLIKERLQIDGIQLKSKEINETIGKTQLTLFNFSHPIIIPLKGEYNKSQGTLLLYYSHAITKLIFSHILWMIFIMFVFSMILSAIVFVWIFYETNKNLILPLTQLSIALDKHDSAELALWPKSSITLEELLRFKEANENYIESTIKHISGIAELAARVAHDIRSPLMTMSIMLQQVSAQLPVEKRKVLEQSIQSVRDIANNLLTRYKDPENNEKTLEHNINEANQERYVLLPSLIELVISQKRYEWQENSCEIHVSVQKEAKIAWLFLAPNIIKRVLSNLLNNAYEALTDRRHIYLDCFVLNNKLILHIKDTGNGIAADKIPIILEGISLKNGNGLGLSGARKAMESLGGELQLISKEKEGTTITLLFSLAESPDWFPKSIALTASKPILFLDDETSIHKFWMNYVRPIRLNHFTNSQDVLEWVKNNPEQKEQMMLLSDHELGDNSKTGLDLLEELQLGKRGYLITSHAEELTIQQRCIQTGIYLIPKCILEEITLVK